MARKKTTPQSIQGNPISLGKASDKYGMSQATLSDWVAKGELTVLKRPERRGQPLLVDEASVLIARANHRRGWRMGGAGVEDGDFAPIVAPSSPASPQYNTAELVSKYIDFGKLRGFTDDTLKSWRSILKGFAQDLPVLPLTSEPILVWLQAATVSQTTKVNRYKTVHAFYNYLADIKGIESPFKPGMRPRRSKNGHFRVLSRDEVARLIDATTNYQDKVMIRVLYGTGLRVGELISLTRDTVFPDHIEIVGKTGRWEIPISQALYQDLMELGRGRLFKNHNGGPLTRDAASHRVARYMEGIGITGKKLGPHTLRHTYLTHLYEDTGDVKLVQEAARHADISVTVVYTHPQAAKQAARLLEHSPLDKLREVSNAG